MTQNLPFSSGISSGLSSEYLAAYHQQQQESLARGRNRVIAAGAESRVQYCMDRKAQRPLNPGETLALREINCIRSTIGGEPTPPLTPEEIQAGEASPIGLPYGLAYRPPGPVPAHGRSVARLAWNAESIRRRGANNIALGQLMAGAVQGCCEPCAKLQAKHDAETAARGAQYAPMQIDPGIDVAQIMASLPPPPPQYGTSYAPAQLVPAACASCIPRPAGVPLIAPQPVAPPAPRPPLAAGMEEIPWVHLGIAAAVGFLLARRI